MFFYWASLGCWLCSSADQLCARPRNCNRARNCRARTPERQSRNFLYRCRRAARRFHDISRPASDSPLAIPTATRRCSNGRRRMLACASWALFITPMRTANGLTTANPMWAVLTRHSMKQLPEARTGARSSLPINPPRRSAEPKVTWLSHAPSDQVLTSRETKNHAYSLR